MWFLASLLSALTSHAGAIIFLQGTIDSRSEEYVIIRTKNHLVYLRKTKLDATEIRSLDAPESTKISLAVTGDAIATILPTP